MWYTIAPYRFGSIYTIWKSRTNGRESRYFRLSYIFFLSLSLSISFYFIIFLFCIVLVIPLHICLMGTIFSFSPSLFISHSFSCSCVRWINNKNKKKYKFIVKFICVFVCSLISSGHELFMCPLCTACVCLSACLSIHFIHLS